MNNKYYAVKTIEKSKFKIPNFKKYVERELMIVSKLNQRKGARSLSRNLIRIEASFDSKSHVYFISELGWVGSMRNFLVKQKKLSLELTRFWAVEIINALRYLTSLNIVHRDIKPENILIDEKFHLKICDFGTAKIYDSNEVFEYYSKDIIEDSKSIRDSESEVDYALQPKKTLRMAKPVVSVLFVISHFLRTYSQNLAFKGGHKKLQSA